MRGDWQGASSKGRGRAEDAQNGECCDTTSRCSVAISPRWEALTGQGAKLRGTYINWAVKERRRLEEELSKKREEVKTKEIEVDHTRGELFHVISRPKLISSAAGKDRGEEQGRFGKAETER